METQTLKKYKVQCYKAGSFKIWKDIEVEAESEEMAEEIAGDSFWASSEIIASNDEVELDLDGQYSEFTAKEIKC